MWFSDPFPSPVPSTSTVPIPTSRSSVPPSHSSPHPPPAVPTPLPSTSSSNPVGGSAEDGLPIPLLAFQNKKRKRVDIRELASPHLESSLEEEFGLGRRQMQGDGSGPVATGYPNCNYESNAILSCYPEGNTTVVESEYSKFIWNVNYPEFFNNGYVDIYLFNANTEEMALEFPGIANARGSIGWAPGEAWWPTEDHWVLGQNVSIPYYFVIVPANTTLTGAEQHQATFTAIQTAPPSSLLSSVLSVSSASVASSRSSVAGLNPSTTPTGGLQDDSHDSGFPDWGIALVVILGFLALLGFALALYFCIKTIRKSKRYRGSEGSIGSGTPIVPQAEKEKAEGAGLLSRGLGLGGSNRNSGHDEEKHLGIPPSVIGAASDRGRKMSSASRKSSRAIIEGPASEEDGPITGNEAAAMADAFRKALRQPLFSNDPSPGSTNSNPNSNEPRASMQLEHSNPSIPQSDSSPILAAGKQAGRDAEDGDGGPGRAPEEEEEGSEEARELIERELAGEGRSLSNHKERKMVGVHGTS